MGPGEESFWSDFHEIEHENDEYDNNYDFDQIYEDEESCDESDVNY